MSPSDSAASYDALPYDAGAIPGAHPDALAVTGRLRGMQPADVERCSVLELGCGTGDNLLALAVALPAANFIGIDASPAQIASGRARAAALGIRNVSLECRLIQDYTPERTFDYILCHGVYSWVPQGVRERILALAATHLAPHGLAYISYNAKPGWHLRTQLRDMLLFHLFEETEVTARVAQARAFLSFAAGALQARTDAWGAMLREEIEALRTRPDTYLFHEFLEEVNEPVAFSDFVAAASAAGLQYLDEVRPLPDANVPAAVRNTLSEAGADRVGAEQYIDFFAGRAFRRSVLAHAHAPQAALSPELALARLRIAAAVTPERSEPELLTERVEAFLFGRARVESNHPAMKTALDVLGRAYPRSISFTELWVVVARSLADAAIELPADSRGMLAEWLIQCHRSGLIDLHSWQAPFTLEPGEQPYASPLARDEAGRDTPLVTSLRHAHVMLHPYDRAVLVLLDGATTRAELAARVASIPPPESAGAGNPVDLALLRLAYSALLLEPEVARRRGSGLT